MEALATLIGLFVFLGLGVAVAVGTVLVVKAARSPGRPQLPAQPLPPAVSPPGWYPATDGSRRVMWWDGSKWSDAPGTN